jgi:hypothetical protein
MKGQGAIELIIILAVSLIILFFIISISNQQVNQLTATKIRSEAKSTVDDLARAAKEVYYQGPGASKKVFVRIPEGIDPTKTIIANKTINLNVLGSDIPTRVDVDVQGSLPSIPGDYFVWVSALEGYVLIGTLSLNAEPSLLFVHFFVTNTSQNTQRDVKFSNSGNSSITVDLNLVWTPTQVNVSFSNPSDMHFLLAQGESKNVTLNIDAGSDAFGGYIGRIDANASNGDRLIVEIEVDVTPQTCPTGPPCGPTSGNCTPQYIVTETFNDSSYQWHKEVFNPSENVTITGTGWNPSSYVTLDIKNPGGFSVVGYPKLVPTNSTGGFTDKWNTGGATTGTYTVYANDSTRTKTTSYDIITCT